jgi:hypothetical protein
MEVSNPSSEALSEKKSIIKDNASEDITMSDLELLANKKKIVKPEVPVEDLLSEKVSRKSSPKSEKKSVKDRSKTKNESMKKSSSTRSSTVSESSSSDDSYKLKKEKTKRINKENKDDTIRREKSTFLYKLGILNSKKNLSHVKLDMDCTLEEIKNEYERVRTTLENEKMVKFCKQMLLMGVQGVEMLNTRFDPLGVDLDGWSEAMGYSMENQEYDEVLSELYEKYKGKGTMSPELKLVLMIVGSAAMFTITKKLTKMEPSGDMLSNILGGFMNRQPPQAQQQQYQMPPQQQQQQYQMPPQQYQQQQYQMPPQQYQVPPQQYQQQFQVPPLGMNLNIPNAYDLNGADSEASSDQPSKLRGPNGSFNSPDSIDLENIIKRMNDNKKQKNNAGSGSGLQDDLFDSEEPEEKQIKSTGTGKRGRPKKVKPTRGVTAR